MGLGDCERVEGAAVAALVSHSRHPSVAREYFNADNHQDLLALVHKGDLHIDGDFVLPHPKMAGAYEPIHLIVLGDLVVDGRFADCDDPESSVLVTGSLRATVIYTAGRLEVGGDLEADMILGDYEDHLCHVGGNLRCQVFWSDEHTFHAAGAEVEHALGPELHLELEAGEVTPMVFGPDDMGDERQLYEVLQRFFVDDMLYREVSADDGRMRSVIIRTSTAHERIRQGLPVRRGV